MMLPVTNTASAVIGQPAQQGVLGRAQERSILPRLSRHSTLQVNLILFQANDRSAVGAGLGVTAMSTTAQFELDSQYVLISKQKFVSQKLIIVWPTELTPWMPK